jgi:hypothetical protein
MLHMTKQVISIMGSIYSTLLVAVLVFFTSCSEGIKPTLEESTYITDKKEPVTKIFIEAREENLNCTFLQVRAYTSGRNTYLLGDGFFFSNELQAVIPLLQKFKVQFEIQNLDDGDGIIKISCEMYSDDKIDLLLTVTSQLDDLVAEPCIPKEDFLDMRCRP